MISRAAASFAGVLGGLAWMLRFALDKLSEGFATGDWGVALLWAGGVWLGLAAATAASRLVRKGTAWLRVVLAVSAALLAWVLWSLADQLFPDVLAEGVIGLVVALASAVLYFRPDRSSQRSADATAEV